MNNYVLQKVNSQFLFTLPQNGPYTYFIPENNTTTVVETTK